MWIENLGETEKVLRLLGIWQLMWFLQSNYGSCNNKHNHWFQWDCAVTIPFMKSFHHNLFVSLHFVNNKTWVFENTVIQWNKLLSRPLLCGTSLCSSLSIRSKGNHGSFLLRSTSPSHPSHMHERPMVVHPSLWVCFLVGNSHVLSLFAPSIICTFRLTGATWSRQLLSPSTYVFAKVLNATSGNFSSFISIFCSLRFRVACHCAMLF